MDDMIAKSREPEDHLAYLKKLFDRLRKYKLHLNPSKCVFGVSSGKLLGYIVNQWGIEVDLSKAKAIVDMPPLRLNRKSEACWGICSTLAGSLRSSHLFAN